MTYTKPEFYVSEFRPNESIAVCLPTETIVDNPVTVDCLLTGSHSVFYDSCAADSNYNNAVIVKNFYSTFKGVTTKSDYLVWGSGYAAGEYNAGDSMYSNEYGHSESLAFSSAVSEYNNNPSLPPEMSDDNNGVWRWNLLYGILDLLAQGGHGYPNTGNTKIHAGVVTPEVASTRNSSL